MSADLLCCMSHVLSFHSITSEIYCSTGARLISRHSMGSTFSLNIPLWIYMYRQFYCHEFSPSLCSHTNIYSMSISDESSKYLSFSVSLEHLIHQNLQSRLGLKALKNIFSVTSNLCLSSARKSVTVDQGIWCALSATHARPGTCLRSAPWPR